MSDTITLRYTDKNFDFLINSVVQGQLKETWPKPLGPLFAQMLECICYRGNYEFEQVFDYFIEEIVNNLDHPDLTIYLDCKKAIDRIYEDSCGPVEDLVRLSELIRNWKPLGVSITNFGQFVHNKETDEHPE